MADKISTVVLKVDLECERCYKKIRKVLCKIQDKQNIKTISFDEKGNTVTVSGPFDVDKLCRKLCCEAGRVIKEMNVKGKESKDGEKTKAAKPAEKDAGKEEKKDAGKPEKKDGGKPEKEAKADKGDAKPEKKVQFVDEPAKPGKGGLPAGMTKADLAPLLEKMKLATQGPQPPRGEPMMVAAQGVAVPSIWPAPGGPMSCYSYNPAYDQSPYYGGGCGAGCGCASCYRPAPPAGGYYGAPVYDQQGWYGANRQPYYQQQPYCGEDPNGGCSVM